MMQTQQHWSTAATPAERALDHWRDIVREHLLDVEIDSDARNDFSGCLTKFSFGPLKANYLCGMAGGALCAPRHLIFI